MLVRLVIGVVVVSATVFALLPPAAAVVPSAGARPVVRGVTHVHSNRSDGTGTVEEIAAAAARAGLRFVVFTDHGNGTRVPDPPTYRSGVLCIDAVEITSIDGHIVALGLSQTPYPLSGDARDVVEDIHRLGGWAVAAHPGSPRPDLAWKDWQVAVDAIEWVNGDSEWRDERPWTLARTLVGYPFRPAESLVTLLDRPEPVLRHWDELLRARPVVGLAAADAHARVGLTSLGEPYDSRVSLPFPSYETVFAAMSITVDAELGGSAVADAASIEAALRAGRVHSTVDGLARGGRLRFWIDGGEGEVREGEATPVGPSLILHARTSAPQGSALVVLRDGELFQRVVGRTLDVPLPAERAVYRVEVTLPAVSSQPGIPWILSNAIHVGGATSASDVERPPSIRRPFSVERLLATRVERAPASEGATSVTNASGAAELLFRYALGGRTADHPYAAAVLEMPEGLGGANRVRFTARADRPMRFSVQVRRPDGPEGHRWRRSVYVDETPRAITIPLADLRPVDGVSPLERERDGVNALLFVVDDGNTPLGPGGRIWIRGLELIE